MASKILLTSLLASGTLAALAMVLDHGPPALDGLMSPDAPPLSMSSERHVTNPISDTKSVKVFESPLVKVDPEEFALIAERTLFNPSRRASRDTPRSVDVQIVSPVVEAASPPPMPNPDEFTLLGVATANGNRVALVRSNKTQEIARLRTGDDYTGWRIAEVRDRSVLIEQKGSVFSLTLFKNEKPTAAQD